MRIKDGVPQVDPSEWPESFSRAESLIARIGDEVINADAGRNIRRTFFGRVIIDTNIYFEIAARVEADEAARLLRKERLTSLIYESIRGTVTSKGSNWSSNIAPSLAAAASEASASRIERPPGYLLDHFLRFVFSKKSYARYYSQLIIDMRMEYIEAIAERRYARARWIVARCYGSVASTWLQRLAQIVINLMNGSFGG